MAGWLVGLDGLTLAAALLFVLLVGLLVLRPLLVAIFSNTPFIGGWLVANIDAGFAAYTRAVLPVAEESFTLLGSAIDWLQATWHGLLDAAPAFAGGVTAALVRVVTVTIPYQVGQAVQLGQAEFAQSVALARDLFQQAELAAASALAVEAALRAQAVLMVEAAAVALFAEAQAQAQAAVAAARAYALSLSAADRAFAVAQAQAATAHADTLFAQSIAVGAAADAALRNDLGAEATALGQAISHGIGQVENQLTAEKIATAGSIAAAVGVVAASISEIENSRCMKVCDPLGAFGEGLQLLDGLAILALIEAITHDPHGMGPVLAEVINPVAQSIGSDLQGLLSV